MENKKADGKVAGIVVAALLAICLVILLLPEKKSPELIAAEKAIEAAEEKRKEILEKIEENKRKSGGAHCLSGWDGAHPAFKNAVKNAMRNPDSFEHISTIVTPVSTSGEHTILMKYRAQNGFGGMNIGNATGAFKNADCSFILLSVE